MKVSVLASGSKGNCTYIETNKIKILIDIGISALSIEKKLINLNINPNEVKNILITHTHVDHVAGLKVFVKKYHPTIYLSKKMYEELKDIIDNYVILDNKIMIEDLTIEYFKTSHDVDSVGYVLRCNNKSLVYVTDTGYINIKNYPLLYNHNVYIFESNHDVKMLMDNPKYPYQIKQRILSDKGHLSNKDSAYYLSKLVGSNTKTIILAHLSELNNDPIIVKEIHENNVSNIDILIAEQDNKMELLEV